MKVMRSEFGDILQNLFVKLILRLLILETYSSSIEMNSKDKYLKYLNGFLTNYMLIEILFLPVDASCNMR